jgi:hypothetical protein
MLNDKILLEFGIDRGMTHAEFYITSNSPVFGELAIRPFGGYYMPLITKVYGFDAWGRLMFNLNVVKNPWI